MTNKGMIIKNIAYMYHRIIIVQKYLPGIFPQLQY